MSIRAERERGGPSVSAPAHKGFGSVVLEQLVAEYCDEQPKVDFDPRGITYEMYCSLGAVAPSSSCRGGT
jgi:two-component sensor histidine kinase